MEGEGGEKGEEDTHRDAKKPRLMMNDMAVEEEEKEDGGFRGGGDNNNNNSSSISSNNSSNINNNSIRSSNRKERGEQGKEEREQGKPPAVSASASASASVNNEENKHNNEGQLASASATNKDQDEEGEELKGEEQERQRQEEEDLGGGKSDGGRGGSGSASGSSLDEDEEDEDEADEDEEELEGLSSTHRELFTRLRREKLRADRKAERAGRKAERAGRKAARETARADQETERADREKARADREAANASLESVLNTIPAIKPDPRRKPAITANNELQKKVKEYWIDHQRYLDDMKVWTNSKLDEKKKKNMPLPPPPLKVHFPTKINHQFLHPELFDFSLVTDKYDGSSIKSLIAVKVQKGLELDADTGTYCFPHDNETTPQTYLDDALQDIQSCLRLASPDFRVVKEFSLFSLRPDLIVVTRHGRIALIVEVKNPSKPSVIFSSEDAAGQVLDYLKVMLQQGTQVPIALLSTYNETSIATFPEQRGEAMENFRKGVNSLKEFYENPKTRQSAQKTTNKLPISPWREGLYQKLDVIGDKRRARSQSEPELENEVDDEIAQVPAPTDESGGFNYDGREVDLWGLASDRGGGGRENEWEPIHVPTLTLTLYKALALVLETACNELAENVDANCLIPAEGEVLKRSAGILTLYESTYNFEPLPAIEVTYNKKPRFNRMKKARVHCQVGQGGSGKVLLCSTTAGTMFAMKLYLYKASTALTPKDRKNEDEEKRAECMTKARKEQSRWNDVNKSEYSCFCRVMTFNDNTVLTMAYFPPVPAERRKDALELIKEILLDLATNTNRKKRYKYAQNDLRWRHFGCRWIPGVPSKMEITLLDLLSLEEVTEEDEAGGIETYIQGQIDELKDRMSTEEVAEPKPVIPRN
eukprot:CAMPEP_0113452774 /NCGR_PEP_ID=MMETSP0014_2-20120614/7017_1 /TAXON_ID=2857 /ORGANISM="Nitzschia sp." /LENGTH=879 /DNA_ID=CAMNT_0000344151 /DNA_START=499 /DNA_END=3138 /DNA_ORIENTATION=+ /assembly_acc=CAM_ASM_000159